MGFKTPGRCWWISARLSGVDAASLLHRNACRVMLLNSECNMLLFSSTITWATGLMNFLFYYSFIIGFSLSTFCCCRHWHSDLLNKNHLNASLWVSSLQWWIKKCFWHWCSCCFTDDSSLFTSVQLYDLHSHMFRFTFQLAEHQMCVSPYPSIHCPELWGLRGSMPRKKWYFL